MEYARFWNSNFFLRRETWTFLFFMQFARAFLSQFQETRIRALYIYFFFLGGGGDGGWGGLRSYFNIQNEPGMITTAGRKITRFTEQPIKNTSISRYIVSWICDTIKIVLSYHLKSINTVFQLTEKFVRIYKYILKIVKLSTILQK